MLEWVSVTDSGGFHVFDSSVILRGIGTLIAVAGPWLGGQVAALGGDAELPGAQLPSLNPTVPTVALPTGTSTTTPSPTTPTTTDRPPVSTTLPTSITPRTASTLPSQDSNVPDSSIEDLPVDEPDVSLPSSPAPTTGDSRHEFAVEADPKTPGWLVPLSMLAAALVGGAVGLVVWQRRRARP